jgi:hypothetical protein
VMNRSSTRRDEVFRLTHVMPRFSLMLVIWMVSFFVTLAVDLGSVRVVEALLLVSYVSDLLPEN